MRKAEGCSDGKVEVPVFGVFLHRNSNGLVAAILGDGREGMGELILCFLFDLDWELSEVLRLIYNGGCGVFVGVIEVGGLVFFFFKERLRVLWLLD